MVEFEIPDKWISNILKISGALIVLVMVATLIRPSVTGNVVNRMNLLSSDLSNCELALNESRHLLENSEDAIYMLTGDLSAINSALYSCSGTLNTTKTILSNTTSSYNSLKEQFDSLSEKHSILRDEFNRSSNNYLELAKFAAQKWCCVRKIDNPDVESYDIIVASNQVACREFSRGTYDLSC